MVGGCPLPQLVCPLIATGLRNKDERKVPNLNFLDSIIPDFTVLGHILTFTEQVKNIFGGINDFAYNF